MESTRNASLPMQGIPTPVPQPREYTDLHAALAFFDLAPSDASRLVEEAFVHGTVDPEIGDWIRCEQVSFPDAVERPLARNAIGRIPEDGEAASFFASTVRLGSGRLFQVQRRYPSDQELETALARGARHEEPALLLRELMVRGRSEDSLDAIDAATIDDV
jgi:hypothetical protein